MPIRIEDPFKDPTTNLKPDVNAFLDRMVEAQANGTLPLAYGPKLKDKVGQWKSELSAQMGKEPESLIVEIGSHMGDVMCEMAQNHPDKAFVGLDITFKRVVTLAEKAQKKELSNIFSVLGNGGGFEHMFSRGEADGLIIFFPDPWVRKKKQRKMLHVGLLESLISRTFSRHVRPLSRNTAAWANFEKHENSLVFTVRGACPPFPRNPKTRNDKRNICPENGPKTVQKNSASYRVT